MLVANGLVVAMKQAHRKGYITDLARNIDKQLDNHYERRSDKIQRTFVKEILIPLAKELLADDPEGLQEARTYL